MFKSVQNVGEELSSPTPALTDGPNYFSQTSSPTMDSMAGTLQDMFDDAADEVNVRGSDSGDSDEESMQDESEENDDDDDDEESLGHLLDNVQPLKLGNRNETQMKQGQQLEEGDLPSIKPQQTPEKTTKQKRKDALAQLKRDKERDFQKKEIAKQMVIEQTIAQTKSGMRPDDDDDDDDNTATESPSKENQQESGAAKQEKQDELWDSDDDDDLLPPSPPRSTPPPAYVDPDSDGEAPTSHGEKSVEKKSRKRPPQDDGIKTSNKRITRLQARASNANTNGGEAPQAPPPPPEGDSTFQTPKGKRGANKKKDTTSSKKKNKTSNIRMKSVAV